MRLFRVPLHLSLFFLFTILITGCSAFNTDLLIIDKIPKNAPKGYIDFYTEKNEDAIELHKKFRGTFFISILENGMEKEIKDMVWSWETRRRIAVKPGMQTFRIKYASADMKITVKAIEGMIVPVKFTYVLGESKYYYQLGRGTMHKQYFNMIPSIEKAVPCSGKQKGLKSDNLKTSAKPFCYTIKNI